MNGHSFILNICIIISEKVYRSKMIVIQICIQFTLSVQSVSTSVVDLPSHVPIHTSL